MKINHVNAEKRPTLQIIIALSATENRNILIGRNVAGISEENGCSLKRSHRVKPLILCNDISPISILIYVIVCCHFNTESSVYFIQRDLSIHIPPNRFRIRNDHRVDGISHIDLPKKKTYQSQSSVTILWLSLSSVFHNPPSTIITIIKFIIINFLVFAMIINQRKNIS